jgi:hypothetical protein
MVVRSSLERRILAPAIHKMDYFRQPRPKEKTIKRRL